MASLKNFAKRMRLRAKQIELGLDKAVKKVALAVDQTVVLATPVDTGRARSNWLVGLGAPVRRTVGSHSPGKHLGIGESANASASIGLASGTINARKPGQDIYISNNLEYINELNNGSSRQAPKNFVEKAAQVGAMVVKGVKILGR